MECIVHASEASRSLALVTALAIGPPALAAPAPRYAGIDGATQNEIVQALRVAHERAGAAKGRQRLEALARRFPVDHEVQWWLKLWIGVSYRYDQPAKALAILKEARQKASDPDTLAAALAHEAALVSSQGDKEAARRMLETQLLDPTPVTFRLAHIPSTYTVLCRDCPERAVKALQQFVDTRRPQPLLCAFALSYIVDLLAQGNRPHDAIRAFDRCVEELGRRRFPNPLALPGYLRALQETGRLREARTTLRSCVASFADDANRVETVLTKWTTECLQSSDAQEALWVVRIGLGLAYHNDKLFEQVLDRFARACKAQRLPLSTVANYRSYLAVGPAGEDGVTGTDDDLASAWQALNVSALEPVEPAAFVRTSLKACGDDYAGRRRAGYMHLATGHVRQALEAFRKARARAGADERKVAASVRGMCCALVAHAGHAGLAAQFLKYHRYGPYGPDGKRGTDDDLSDPTADVLAEPRPSSQRGDARDH